jgi:large subunit ribosomal protein L4
VAKAVKLKELPELGLTEPNLLHVQESYLRHVAHAKRPTAKKQRKSDVTATGAKWYRQKGTGRARQGARINPHMRGGGLAFPPRPIARSKRLNKHVRRSGLRSAVFHHVSQGSAYVVQGKDFDDIDKTKEVAAILGGIPGGQISLVLRRGSAVWRSCRNIWNVRLLAPTQVNVRDLVETDCLVFAQSALDEYRALLKREVEPPDEEDTAEGNVSPAPGSDASAGGED